MKERETVQDIASFYSYDNSLKSSYTNSMAEWILYKND